MIYQEKRAFFTKQGVKLGAVPDFRLRVRQFLRGYFFFVFKEALWRRGL
jgi:hypothetical protein